MAKKEKAAEWQAPEFDEVEFMHKEMRAARATIAVILWTVPAALLSYGLTLAGVAIVAFFAGIGMMFLLKWILPILRVDISAYKRKEWISHGGTFFFSWLAFWILLLNPPFADLTSPTIFAVTVNGVRTDCGGGLTSSTNPAVLNVTAGDNVAVAEVLYQIGSTSTPMTPVGGGLWTARVPKASTVTILARDPSGHYSAPCTINIG